MDNNPGATFTARLNDLQYILPLHQDPAVLQTYLDDVDQRYKLFGGQLMPLKSVTLSDRGLVRRYELAPPDNAVVMGVVDADTERAANFTQGSWTNLRWQPTHISDIELTVQYDERSDWEIMQAYGPDLGKVAEYLERQAAKQLNRLTAALLVADRRGIIGYVGKAVSGTTSDDTTNSQYVFDLYLTAASIPAAFGVGSLLQMCAPPTGFGAITTVRNYTAFIKVIGPLRGGKYESTYGSVYYVKVAAPYTADTKTTVKTQIDSIVDNDPICRWAGATAGTTSLPTNGGANFGLCGGRFWWETNGSGTFANIEECSGAITQALVTDENTPRTVSRNATSKEWDMILNPLVIEGGGGNVGSAAAMGYIDDAARELRLRNGDWVTPIILVAPPAHRAIRDFIGTSSIYRWENVDDEKRKVMQRWGTSGFVYQGETGQPVIVGQSMAIPADCVLMIANSGAFETAVGNKTAMPRWLPGEIGGHWSIRRNASGNLLHSYQATMHQALQMIPAVPLGNVIAVVRNLVPTS